MLSSSRIKNGLAVLCITTVCLLQRCRARSYCDPVAIESCQRSSGIANVMADVGLEFHAHFDILIETKWLFNLTQDEGHKLCILWPSYYDCLVGKVFDDCDTVSRALIIGIDSAMRNEYCSILVPHEFYSNWTACMRQQVFWDRIGECRHDFVNDTTGEVADRDYVCKQKEETIRYCINNAVDHTCGWQEFTWFLAYYQAAYTPLYHHYDCDAWPHWLMVNIIIGVLLAVLIFSCALACYIRIRRTNRRTLQTDNDVFMTSQQPVYRPVRSGRRPKSRHSSEVKLQDAAMTSSLHESATELVSICDRRTLVSNELL